MTKIYKLTLENNVFAEGLKLGDTMNVVKTFFRNGEGWVRLDTGKEIPDIFVEKVKVSKK